MVRHRVRYVWVVVGLLYAGTDLSSFTPLLLDPNPFSLRRLTVAVLQDIPKSYGKLKH